MVGCVSRGGNGVACRDGASPLIADNVITGGYTHDGAAGFYIWNSSPTVINNLIYGNDFCESGTVIGIMSGSSPVLINNTLAHNEYDSCHSLGSIYVWSDCNPLIVNCIVWDQGRSVNQWYTDGIPIRHCDLKFGDSLGPGCIDANPLFVSGPLGDYYLSQVEAGQEADSPCLDTGDPGTSSPGGTTRTDGGPDAGVPDMGYHYESFAVVCDLDGSGRVDGIDLSIIGRAFGAGEGDPRYIGSADFDRNGVIDGEDLAIFSFYFGATI